MYTPFCANTLPGVLKLAAFTVALLLKPPAPTLIFDTLIAETLSMPLTVNALYIAPAANTLPDRLILAPVNTALALPKLTAEMLPTVIVDAVT